MDLQLYARVLWRFRILLLAGFVLAVLLAVLALVRIDPSGPGPTFSYREQESFVSYTTLWVTPETFPWGSATIAPQTTDPRAQAKELGIQIAPTDWFSSLAIMYSQLAMSDSVRQIMQEDGRGPINGTIETAPVLNDNDALPFIRIAAIAPSPSAAVSLAQREVDAFKTFLLRQQEANAIPAGERVMVKVSQQAETASLFKGRGKTRPIMIFLTVLVVFVGLAFILENLRPRVPRASAAAPPVRHDAARKSA